MANGNIYTTVITFLFFLLVIIFVSGCGKKPARCNDQQSKNLVKDVAHQELSKMIGDSKAKSITYKIFYVRTQEYNENTTLSECRAYLYIYKNSKHIDTINNLQYTVQTTDDEQDIMVSVSGLSLLDPCKYGFNEFCKKQLQSDFNLNEY